MLGIGWKAEWAGEHSPGRAGSYFSKEHRAHENDWSTSGTSVRRVNQLGIVEN